MLHAVILAGGSGTRFWPLSREKMPKQLLHILGDQSMLAMTLDRACALVPEERIWIVTTRSQASGIKQELHRLHLKKLQVIEEPAGRNTAAAIGLAAVRIHQNDPKGVLAVLPADHHIEKKDRFLELLHAGKRVAETGWLVTLGISPTRPETGYGYIKKGSRIDSLDLSDLEFDVFKVSRFTEKPDQETAEKYLCSGDFFWNSGIFLWRADQFMDEMKRSLPEHHRGLMEIGSLGDFSSNTDRVEEIYEGLTAISVDYGIMEHSDKVAMIPANVGWSDVGSWAALREINEKDLNGNVVKGNVLAVDSRNSLLYGQDRLVAALGLEGLVVVDTPDAVLVCREDMSQDVRKIVKQLLDEGRDEALVHREVLKSWGAYKVLDRGEAYQLGWLDVLPGEQLSLKNHAHRAAHWIVVAGTATVTVNDRIVDAFCGEHIHVPEGSLHRVENRGSEKLRMIEIQTSVRCQTKTELTMRIVLIGTGYVGLVSGACLAEFGHHVVCVDKDQDKIASLKQGIVPIYEPGLNDMVERNVSQSRLFFTTHLEEAVEKADAVFIAVGTPSSRRGDGYADLTYVYEAARELAPFLKAYTVVVDKSTVPVGTARQVKRLIKEANPDADFDVASNPEFLREGAALGDFMRPDRVVIGVDSDRAADVLKRVYQPLYLIETPMVITGLETAELIKYAANAFLATKISFINEMASLCEAVGGDVVGLAKGIGLDGRIGKKFLHPGPGYGGSCFPKDTLALIRVAQEHGSPSRIVETVVEVNAAQKARMIWKIRNALGGCEAGKTIAVLGLTFKPETDDMRESPSLTVLPALVEKGAIVRAHDPQGRSAAEKLMPELQYLDDPYETCIDASGVVLMTEWNQYRALDLKRIKDLMKDPVFIDLRNVYDPTTMSELGFSYTCVGRANGA